MLSPLDLETRGSSCERVKTPLSFLRQVEAVRRGIAYPAVAPNAVLVFFKVRSRGKIMLLSSKLCSQALMQ